MVGVVAPTRYRDLLAPRATLYTPFSQALMAQDIGVRASADPSAVILAIRTAVRNTDSRVYLADFATLTARIDSTLATERLSAFLLGAFALAILLLTSIGLYSVAATFVRQRELEIVYGSSTRDPIAVSAAIGAVCVVADRHRRRGPQFGRRAGRTVGHPPSFTIMVQAIISFTTVALLAARAVNIL